MRRMNYNPFEKPFASGEYSPTLRGFDLDRNIEIGSIYYARIVDSDTPYQTSAIIDTTEYGALSFNSTPFEFNDVSGTPRLFFLAITARDNKVYVISNDYDPPTQENSQCLIYIYKIA